MRSKQLFISLTLGLGLTLALLWLLGGETLPAAHAAGSQCPGQRPLLQAGGIITVCLSGGCDYTSIQSAVDAASSGDEILVAGGVYTGVNVRPRNDVITTGVVTQVVYISKTVSIRGGYTTTNWTTPYPITQPTTLDAQGRGRVLYITGDISPTIEGLRITGGALGHDFGGGVYIISATMVISGNKVFSNTGWLGGGLFLWSGVATLTNNTVSTNTASEGGGLSLNYGDAVLISNTIAANTAEWYGGGLEVVSCTATLTNNNIISNASASGGAGGGGLYAKDSNVMLTNNTVASNTAVWSGGGLLLIGGDATLSGNAVTSNTAEFGGGLFLEGSAATLNDNTVTSNDAAYEGGGLFLVDSAATLISNTVTSNTAKAGGGGGLYLYGNAATLNGNNIISNTAVYAGGLYLEGSAATLNGNNIISNTASGTAPWGGGGGLVLVDSDAMFSGNIIASNTTTDRGGGLFLGRSDATLTNTVIADNQAGTAGSGLYIYGASPRMLHTTIARNNGGDGSGVYVCDNGLLYSTVALTNTILVSHGVGISVTGGNTVTVNGVLWYSTPVTVSQATTATVTVQNQHEGNPAFAADGYHLTAGSAAIDRGVNAGVTTDIDGQIRDAIPDLGADEHYKIYLPLIMRQYS